MPAAPGRRSRTFLIELGGKGLKKFIEIVTKIEETLMSTAVILMAIILVAGVIARTVFNSSLTFTEELGIALMIAVTFLGIGYCARRAQHISMSIFYDLTNVKVKKVLMCIISLFTCLAMLYVCYLCIRYVGSVRALQRVTPALRIPMWIIYLALPIGFFFGALEYGRCFVQNILHRDEVWISSLFRLGENEENYDDAADASGAGGEGGAE